MGEIRLRAGIVPRPAGDPTKGGDPRRLILSTRIDDYRCCLPALAVAGARRAAALLAAAARTRRRHGCRLEVRARDGCSPLSALHLEKSGDPRRLILSTRIDDYRCCLPALAVAGARRAAALLAAAARTRRRHGCRLEVRARDGCSPLSALHLEKSGDPRRLILSTRIDDYRCCLPALAVAGARRAAAIFGSGCAHAEEAWMPTGGSRQGWLLATVRLTPGKERRPSPADPQHPNRRLPLLPSGPGGVCRLSS